MDIGRRAHTRIYFLLLVSLCVCLSENLVTSAVIRDGKGNLFRLSLIHYNDFHARFEETTNTFPVCSTNDSNCLGGFARLYQEIQLLLRERPDSIVLNAGDVFQGTYWYTLLKWNATQKFINLLPNDVHTIGNHEFDDGIAGLAPYLAGLNAPVVVANIDTSKEPSLEGLYSPHIILTRKGRKIGIIGLITNSTAMSSNVEKVVFLDPIETAKKEAKILTQKGVDIILVLSHCGLAVDKEIAREVGDNIDVIIGGHSHSLLWNGDAPETVSGPYPVIETAQNGHKVVIVTASAYSKFLGNLTLYFDDKGEMKYLEGEPIYLNRSIPEDPLIKAMLMPYLENLHNIVNDVVGYASIEMNDDNCGFGECVLGNFIADAFLNNTKLTIQTDLPHVSFILRNMIRGAIPQGNITKGVVINTLPITNQVVTFPVKGMDLLKGFEFALKETWRKKPFAGPFVPHVAGIKLTLNTTSETVHSVYVSEGTNWIPLNPEQEYQLTTVKFLLKGGNKFEMFKKYEKQAKTLGVDHEIFEKYIKSKPTTPTLDNRLVLVV